jgi:ubiquinone/menaquinone biosynthesis C-methylase UbiE
MQVTASEQEIAAALAYEDLHVPALFQQWATKVVKAAEIGTGQRVLDVACGTGVLAREALLCVGEKGLVAGLDASAGMLAVAEQQNYSIEWREGLAESLPYADASFDAVVSQFGLMFFKDRRLAIQEMLRVLAPGGKLVVVVWDSLENSAAYPFEVELLENLVGHKAADALRAPFVLGDREELMRLFQDAGAAAVEITTSHGIARFPSIRVMVEADLRGWLPVMGVVLSEEQIGLILKEAEKVLSQYVTVEGTMEFDAPAHLISATNRL